MVNFDSHEAHNFVLLYLALRFQVLLRTSAVCLLDKQIKCLIKVGVTQTQLTSQKENQT
jgi:hypothetical protein